MLRRLKPVEAGYDIDGRCMEGTRQYILNQVLNWVANTHASNGAPRTYWLYGSPGIGKSSLAHSICEKLHHQKHLAGGFFCRRDDPNLSKPKNVLPTLINTLAEILPSFRSIVADRLRTDPNLTSNSMNHSLFLDFICKLPRDPDDTLVFVIDALDECGDHQSRPGILNALTDSASQAPWLKVVITSRPEIDIERFFDAPNRSSHLRYDLATDQEASADLRTFAKSKFDFVASRWYLPTPWPEESLFDRVITRANGLFIFVQTIVLALEHCNDPTESLKETLQDSAGTRPDSLYSLYSSILRARIRPGDAEFQRVIGVLLATAPYRALREDAIAELARVKPNVVKKWVDDLSSLLYRDDEAQKGIRVRHLSISDFFFSESCHSDYQVNLRDANMELGISCIQTMIHQLRFNICELEDSRLANADVKNLQSRIERNISGALQYSSVFWSNHLCSTPDNGDVRMWEILKEFFEGVYLLFWIEVLSITGMVPIGVPSLRRVISWVMVGTAQMCLFCF